MNFELGGNFVNVQCGFCARLINGPGAVMMDGRTAHLSCAENAAREAETIEGSWDDEDFE